MSLLNQFKSFVERENLFKPKDRLLIAVSGGVDSVVLCELCHLSGFRFTLAHCNFQLRGEESNRDEEFVRALANKYGVKLLVKTFDTEKYALLHRVSIQVAARDLRYDWFRELAGEKKSGDHSKRSGVENLLYNILGNSPGTQNETIGSNLHFDWILTAHHLDDNIETVLMNFFKGTGVAGLRGMKPRNGKIIRPLLFAKKNDLLTFAGDRNLLFVEDSSNSSDKYSRNYFRRQIIPLIQKIYPEAEHNIGANIERLRDIEVLYNQAVDQHKKKLLEHRGSEIFIPVLKLLKTQPLRTIVFEIIKDYSFTVNQVDEVLKLVESDSGKYIQSSTHRILKHRNWFIISKLSTYQNGFVLIEDEQRKIHFESGSLHFEKITNAQEASFTKNETAFLDAAEIKFPLLLRKWKKGDYFYPLGMSKKKKLSRFFIDQKMSTIEKEKTWVIEMNKKIIWVVGKRIDDRVKITGKTKSILKIAWEEL
ncbi:MAG: tRNA lysidine(34) synthetase TilS [Bacteroidetes bacterium]|nr:MAG: tRNA lysidine(34) synthetase TilS [Bacteroidota bacterium]